MGTAPRTSLLSAIVLLLASSATARAQDPAPVVREGKHFRVVFHGAELPPELAVALADECLAAAEAFWPILDKLLPVRAGKPGTIHVYRSEKEYRGVETKSVRFPLDAFVAKDGEAHVRLYPPLSKAVLSAIGVPLPALDDLRRVAAEQVVAPLAPPDDDQDWLRTVVVMGAVELAANPRHLPGVDSAHDARRYYDVVRGTDAQRPRFSSLLNVDMVAADRAGWDVRLAQCAWVAQVLAAENGWARRLLGKQRELRGLSSAFERRLVAVGSVLGDDAEKNEARWVKTCKAMRPVWFAQSGVWEIGPQRSMLVGTGDQSALVVSVEPPPKGDYMISGRAELGAGDPETGFRVEVGWDERSVLAINFAPGRVGISVWDVDKRRWLDKATAKAELGAGKAFEFRVEVTRSELRAIVDGTQRIAWAHGGRELHTPSQIGVGDRVIWLEGLRVEPLAPAKK